MWPSPFPRSNLLVRSPAEDEAADEHAAHVAALDGRKQWETTAHKLPLCKDKKGKNYDCFNRQLETEVKRWSP